MKRTKIVATMGPASFSEEMLMSLINSGMNVARLNFSHGEYAVHGQTIANIRKVDDKLGIHTALLADLQGPKLRVGDIVGGEMNLIKGEELIIRTGKEDGANGIVYTNYSEFARDVKPGEPVLMDDGKLELKVLETDRDHEVRCEVVHGGKLKPRKGINLPSTVISLPCITEKDEADLAFALEQEVDWIGLSFVRNAQDILDLRSRIEQSGKHARIVAKIEKPEALEDLDAILEVTDAVMIARGDLGVEIPKQEVPLVQKDIIKRCMVLGRPVIVATQMMESMIEHSVPTRAEVNDVANAVLDGADAVMLSAETSVGAFPVQAVQAMTDIIHTMESHDGMFNQERPPLSPDDSRFISDSMCYNACRLAKRVNAEAIVTMTYSGYTAIQVSSQRPKAYVYMFTANKKVLGQMSLVWGVTAFPYLKMVSTDHTIADIKFELTKMGVVTKGDFVVHLASMPIAEAGMTNMVKLSQV
jgi:pyruvate kinase